MATANGRGSDESFYAELVSSSGGYKTFINGQWQESESNKTVPISNPSTLANAYSMQACTINEVDRCYESATSAQGSWSSTPLYKRAEILHKAASLLRDHAATPAQCLVKEVAKPAKDALNEVLRSADLIDYTAEEGLRVLGQGKLLNSDSFPGQARNKLCMVSKVPLGVILCIPPFNYPINLAVSKIAPALMAGNAVVLKPPTQGAISGLHLVQCFNKAGLPPGLINVVTGKVSEFGDHLTTHPSANMISFTGGATGISISKKAGMVPLQMELGGKDVCIVCEDADLDLAAKNIVKGGFSYSGQRCTAVKCVLVVDTVAEALVQKVVPLVQKLSVGMPEDDRDITPVISTTSADFIEGLYKDAVGKGAVELTAWKREGNLIWPTLLDRVTPEMKLAWEEPFGPLLPIIRVSSVAEAIEHCNKNDVALQGCVFTKDINRAIVIADQMKTGTVQINSAPARGPDHFPFQGFRNSGIGSQGITNTLEMMVKMKSTVINLDTESYARG